MVFIARQPVGGYPAIMQTGFDVSMSKRETADVKRIVIFSLSALGDLLLAVPVLSASRRIYSGARLVVVCERDGTAAFARELGLADEVIQLPSGARRSPLALWQT